MAKTIHELDEYKGSALTTFIILPAPPLREYIDYYYGEEASINDFSGSYMPHQVILMPGGNVEIQFSYHDTSFRLQINNKKSEVSSFIAGGTNINTIIYVDGFKKVCKEIHIRFKPGGFCKLFGIPEIELRNNFFEIGEVLGKSGKETAESLNYCVSLEERIRKVDHFFLQKIKTKRRKWGIENIIAATNLILEGHGRISVKSIFKELSISERTLERQFISYAGLTPKEFSRVVRFKEVLNKVLLSKEVNWCKLALDYGYYDQAHLINEFKSATTFSPEKFLQERGKSIVKFRTGLFILKPVTIMSHSYKTLMDETIQSEEKGGKLI